MNLILRTIPNLLVISRIPSETPNNIRSLTHHSITTQQHQILKCVSLRFGNYADMTETLLRSITHRGIWKFIWLPHISTMTHQVWNLEILMPPTYFYARFAIKRTTPIRYQIPFVSR